MDNGLAICTIYDKREGTRPECIVFPEAPPILVESCGFYFLDTWQNNRPVKYGKDL